MIVNSIDVYRKLRLYENESSILRSIMKLEDIQKIIEGNGYAKKLMEDAMKIRSEIKRLEEMK